MATFVHRYTQDLRRPLRAVFSGGLTFTGDILAHRLEVEVLDGGSAAALAGTVSGTAIRADGQTVAFAGSFSGNVASVTLPRSAYAVPGPLAVFITITTESGSTATTLLKAVYSNDLSSTDTIVDPGTIIPSVNALLAAIESAVDSIPADYSTLLTSIAPTFSASTSYTAGDYVWYNGTLYRFTKAKSAGSWAASSAVAVALGLGVSDAETIIRNTVGSVEITNWVNGEKIMTSGYTTLPVNSPTTDANYRYAVVSCAAGDVFTISGHGSSNSRLWTFTDSSFTVITQETASSVTTNLTLTAPTGSAYLVLNDDSNAISYIGNPATLRFADIETDLHNIISTFAVCSAPMVRGNISGTSGSTSGTGTSTTSMRTRDKITMYAGDVIVFDSTKTVTLFEYNAETDAYIGYTAIVSGYTLPADFYGYIRIGIDSSVTDDQINMEWASMVRYSPRYYNRAIASIQSVTTARELAAALGDTSLTDIYILADIETSSEISVKGDKHIHGNGHGITGVSTTRYLLYITSGNVIIEDATLSTASDDVVFVGGDSIVKLVRCDVSHSYANDGIGTHGTSKCYVIDCVLHDCYDEGISTHDSSYAEVIGTEAYKCGYVVGTDTVSGASFAGIHIGGGQMGRVCDCYAHDNTSYGIAFIPANNQDIRTAECLCVGNTTHGNVAAGIAFSSARNIQCYKNTLADEQRGLLFQLRNGYEYGCAGNVAGQTYIGTTTNVQIYSGGDDGLVFDAQ